MNRHIEILIVGAGMSGLQAARKLRRAGREVLVLDKGRGFGGRMASRRFAGAFFEHGAHSLEARHLEFAAALQRWENEGVAAVWCAGSPIAGVDGPRYRGRPGINALAAHLAEGIEVLREVRVESLSIKDHLWQARLDGSRMVSADLVLLTCPIPQSLALIDAEGIPIKSSVRKMLLGVRYEPCLTVMAALENPSLLEVPGLLEPGSGPIARLCDHQIQGSSPNPAVTIQATAVFSREHWDVDRQETARLLLAAAEPWLGGPVKEHQIHGWRYARPETPLGETCLVIREKPTLVLTGDAFGGVDLESAFLSGRAAAEILLRS